MYTYQAIVTNVYDGDTLTVDVDLGFGIWFRKVSLRLAGLNAPELPTPEGKKSKAELGFLVGKRVTITTQKDKREKYGRYLAEITLDNVNINAKLIAEGFAKPWDGKGSRPV